MSEAAALRSEDTVVGIVRGILGFGGTERWALFHASIDEIDTISVLTLHAPEPGQDVVLFAHSRLRPFDLDAVIAGEGFNPFLVVIRALTKDLLDDAGTCRTSRKK